MFGIKQTGQEIKDLTRSDINQYRNQFDIEELASECDSMNYFYDELKIYKSFYSNYSGNSFTYYVFKQFGFCKQNFILTKVYLYRDNGQIFTYKELLTNYKILIINHPNPHSIKTITQLIFDKSDKEVIKIKYQFIKVMEPCDINYLPLSNLNLYLIDASKPLNFNDSYDTLIEKSFGSFLDYEQVIQNS